MYPIATPDLGDKRVGERYSNNLNIIGYELLLSDT